MEESQSLYKVFMEQKLVKSLSDILGANSTVVLCWHNGHGSNAHRVVVTENHLEFIPKGILLQCEPQHSSKDTVALKSSQL